jgi:hypothetical protein
MHPALAARKLELALEGESRSHWSALPSFYYAVTAEMLDRDYSVIPLL